MRVSVFICLEGRSFVFPFLLFSICLFVPLFISLCSFDIVLLACLLAYCLLVFIVFFFCYDVLFCSSFVLN